MTKKAKYFVSMLFPSSEPPVFKRRQFHYLPFTYEYMEVVGLTYSNTSSGFGRTKDSSKVPFS